MIDYDEALGLVIDAASPLDREIVPLDEAHGRFLAAPVVAMVDSPPADVSAMDGYAFTDPDASSARLVGASWPGTPFSRALQGGECVRIFTGAAVPTGATRVVVQEVVRVEGDCVIVTGGKDVARHIRRRASDFASGDTLLAAGHRLGPLALVTAAGADRAEIEIWRRPRVTVLSTGDELSAPGTARDTPGTIPESISIAIAALIAEQGGTCLRREQLRDDPALITAAARRALEGSDLLVMVGGASVGEKDYAKAALGELGLELIFSRVAMKPGKPVWFGRALGKWVLGLPGNPGSALVTGRLLLAPLLRGLAGGAAATALRWRQAPLAAPLGPCGDRETFVRGVWRDGAVEAIAQQDSGAQRALAEAELLIRRRRSAPAADSGTMVEIIAL